MKLAIALCLLVAACGDNADRCLPAAQQMCGCPSGATGTQTCGNDGTWKACTDCPAPLDAAVDATCGPGVYPCGPYGYQIGSTVANLAFVGQRDDNGNGHIDSGDTPVLLHLSDLAAPGVDAIMIDVCAAWCGPCNADQPGLVTLAQSYGSRVVFFGVIVQTASRQPGDLTTVDHWGTQYHVPYPMAADPDGVTQLYLPVEAYPEHLVIRTSNMTLVWRNNGDDPMLQTQIDAILANP
jgi:hypothetical protein